MDEKRVNNTDPVVQVRLRVMVGNFHGALKKVCLAAGFVYPELSANYQYERVICNTRSYQTNHATFPTILAIHPKKWMYLGLSELSVSLSCVLSGQYSFTSVAIFIFEQLLQLCLWFHR